MIMGEGSVVIVRIIVVNVYDLIWYGELFGIFYRCCLCEVSGILRMYDIFIGLEWVGG